MKIFTQIFLPVYGLILIFGGIKGYQAKSQESLYMGAGSGIACLLLTALSTKYPRIAFILASIIAGTLTGVMGWRFEKTGRLVPAGMIAITSLLATGVTVVGAATTKSE